MNMNVIDAANKLQTICCDYKSWKKPSVIVNNLGLFNKSL